MFQRLTFGEYSTQIGTAFVLIDDDMPPGVIFTLRDVLSPRRSEPDPASKNFSLEFTSPGPEIWPQRMYRVRHEVLGETEMFAVPIGYDPEGIRYEAVFN